MYMYIVSRAARVSFGPGCLGVGFERRAWQGRAETFGGSARDGCPPPPISSQPVWLNGPLKLKATPRRMVRR